MKLSFFISVVLLATSSVANAKGWSKEPDSFMGVPIGKAIPETIAECPASAHERIMTRTLCVDRSSARFGMARIYGVPREIEFIGYPYILLKDGVVSAITIKAKTSDFPKIRSLFIERYGRPTDTKKVTLQNAMGARADSEILTWTGEVVRIEAREITSNLNESGVQIVDLSGEAKRNNDIEQGIKRGAGAL